MSMLLPIGRIGPADLSGPGNISASTAAPGQFTKIDGVGETKVKTGDPFDSEAVKLQPLDPPDIKMSQVETDRLVTYMSDELWSAYNERFEQMIKLARLRVKYRTEYPEYPKDWPIANASQITIPIIKTHVNTTTARVYQTIVAADPIASVRTRRNNEFQDQAFDLEEFLDLYSKEKLDFHNVADTWATETVMLGTGILETTEKFEKKKHVKYNPVTKKYVQELVTTFNGPIIYCVPIEDFWMRIVHQDSNKAPWCGKEVRWTWSQIKDRAVDGTLDPKQIDRIWQMPQQQGDVGQITQADEKVERAIPFDRDEYRLFEVFVRWDVDGDGVDEDVFGYFHWESRTFLRKRFNTFPKCLRPYQVTQFSRIPHRMYGEGLAEMLEGLQDEISTTHNQRIDNATIANLKIILVSKLIKGLAPGDRLWSGKIVRVSDVDKDVGTLQLGEIYPNTVTSESIARGYAQELTGVGETAAGTAQPVSRTTATAQLALLEELNRRFDKAMLGFRRSISASYKLVTALFIARGTDGLAEIWLGPKRGQRLEQFLSQDYDYVMDRLAIQVMATRSTVNREVEFQSSIAVMNLIIQQGQQAMNLAQMFKPELAGVVAYELVQAIRPVFKKVMQYATSSNVDEAMGVLNVLERILPSPESIGLVGDPNQGPRPPALPPDGTGINTGSNGDGGTSDMAPNSEMLQRMDAMEASLRQGPRRNSRMDVRSNKSR